MTKNEALRIARRALEADDSKLWPSGLRRNALAAIDAALCQEDADEIERLRAENNELRRWKSTHAPRIEALQHLKDHAQAEAAMGVEARATLDSERAANAILTDELERLRAELAQRGEPAFLHAGDGGPAFPASVVATWPERNRARMTEPLYAAAPQRKPLSDEDIVADAIRFRWLCAHPDWHFIEHLCREFVADSSAEFMVELRRVIDARRAVELDPVEQHITPHWPWRKP